MKFRKRPGKPDIFDMSYEWAVDMSPGSKSFEDLITAFDNLCVDAKLNKNGVIVLVSNEGSATIVSNLTDISILKMMSEAVGQTAKKITGEVVDDWEKTETVVQKTKDKCGCGAYGNMAYGPGCDAPLRIK